MDIDTDIFEDLDLNLLVTFFSVYNERSVTYAAVKLGVRQPAVSGSLVRLRKFFCDPLFERCRYGVAPTLKAERLYGLLAPHIHAIEKIIIKEGGIGPRRY